MILSSKRKVSKLPVDSTSKFVIHQSPLRGGLALDLRSQSKNVCSSNACIHDTGLVFEFIDNALCTTVFFLSVSIPVLRYYLLSEGS